MRACSKALAAVVALPDRDRCQPRSSRVWQSMTRASVVQPSRPAQTRYDRCAKTFLAEIALAATVMFWL
jgi:hypothetical protein